MAETGADGARAPRRARMGGRRRIALDTETTGLELRPAHEEGGETVWPAEVLSLAIVDGEGAVLLDRTYRPAHHDEWPGAQRVNGISPEDVASRPPILDDKDEIEAILRSADEVVVYNAAFDIAVLRNSGIDVPEGAEVIDAMVAFAEAWGDRDRRHGGFRRQSLSAAAAAVGHEWTGAAHGALADARAALAVQDALDAGWRRGKTMGKTMEGR